MKPTCLAISPVSAEGHILAHFGTLNCIEVQYPTVAALSRTEPDQLGIKRRASHLPFPSLRMSICYPKLQGVRWTGTQKVYVHFYAYNSLRIRIVHCPVGLGLFRIWIEEAKYTNSSELKLVKVPPTESCWSPSWQKESWAVLWCIYIIAK